ncbi:MAG: VWA domain-containing protein [Deltaproteobacteria bacterium]|nr:VWA domain-containing protein [Deltaproteobacteria bacterium]
MHLHSPWALLLIIPLIAVLVLRKKTAKTGAVRFSSVQNAARAGRSIRLRLSWLPTALRILAVLFLILAAARPQTGREKVREVSRGVAIEMVVDRSGSMKAEMEYAGNQITRLDVVKKVFSDFVLGNGDDLPGRPNDLVGMIAFARYPETVCPLTLAHGALPLFLKQTKLVTRKSEDGTAIGDALALAAARLDTAEKTLAAAQKKKKKTYEIKSKIIILLSDGQNNRGKMSPEDAAKLAKKWGIRVYSIAIGGGDAMASVQTPFGVYKMPISAPVDFTALEKIAEITGGVFKKADNAESLRQIYKQIDKMEKSEIESVRYVDYRENFLIFVLLALALLGLEVTLSTTLFRRIP